MDRAGQDMVEVEVMALGLVVESRGEANQVAEAMAAVARVAALGVVMEVREATVASVVADCTAQSHQQRAGRAHPRSQNPNNSLQTSRRRARSRCGRRSACRAPPARR